MTCNYVPVLLKMIVVLDILLEKDFLPKSNPE